MNPLPLPAAWRSEAFPEDLAGQEMPPPPPRWRHRLTTVLLGVVPVALATGGAALAAWISF